MQLLVRFKSEFGAWEGHSRKFEDFRLLRIDVDLVDLPAHEL